MSAGDGAVRHERPASARMFLAVAASAVFVSMLAATIVSVLVPLIGARFGTSVAEERPQL